MFVQNGGFASFNIYECFAGVEAGQGTELKKQRDKEGTLIVEAKRLYVASFPIFLCVMYVFFWSFFLLLLILNKV